MALIGLSRDVVDMSHALLASETDETREEDTTSREPGALLERALVKQRTVLVFGEVTTDLAHRTTAQLFALAAMSDEPVRVVVHSQGGHVEAADTIHDVIRFIRPEVVMIGSGWVASAGALIYCAVPRQRRLSLPNTRYLLHQPLGGFRGRADEIEIETRQILRMRQRLHRLFADATGQPLDRIAEDTERNHWLDVAEAEAYGLVGRVIRTSSEI
jgi:ATP-dependent Clp protease protease subunit